MVLPSIILHLLSLTAGVSFVSGYALLPMLGGLVLLWGGWALLRAYGLPILILIFMVPMPEVAVADLNFELKMIASRAAAWITDRVFQVGVVVDGSSVYLPGHTAAAPKVLLVEDVCSGLRSLIALTFFAALFALVCRVKGWWRLFLLLMAVPVAVACNVVRITALNLVADRWGVEAASETSAFHSASGLAVFALALGFMFALEMGIISLGRVLKRAWLDQRLLGYLDDIPRGGEAPNLWRSAPLLTLAGVAVLSVIFTRTPARTEIKGVIAAVAPRQVTLADGRQFRALPDDRRMTPKELEILENPAYLFREFVAPSGGAFDVLVTFSANNRKAIHPPDICLKGSGYDTVEKTIRYIPMPGRAPIKVRELRSVLGGRDYIFLYVYKCGASYTPSFFWQQALVFWNGLAGRFYGDAPTGALIRFGVRADKDGIERARSLALNAAETLLPQIDRRIDRLLANQPPGEPGD
jgi:exosortase